MRNKIFKALNSFIIVITISLLNSCQSTKESNPAGSLPVEVKTPIELGATVCKEPRTQVCTREFRPVCASRDTGVRCVTTPCASTEQVTKSNACTACADSKVVSYISGACVN